MTADATTPTHQDALVGFVTDIAALTPELVDQVHRILAPVSEARTAIRGHLLSHPNHPIHQHAPYAGPPLSISAIDGATATENLYAADLISCVACSANGTSATAVTPPETPSASWFHVAARDSHNKTLAAAVMGALELHILASCEHDLRIIDGATTTSLLSVIQGLSDASESVRETTANVIEQFYVIEAVTAYATAADGTIVALPKADSSTAYSRQYATETGHDLPGGDRMLAAQILEPGEYLHPRITKDATALSFWDNDAASNRVRGIMTALGDAAEPLLADARAGRVHATYFKSHANPDVAIKVEYRGTADDAHDIIAALAAQCGPAPLQEPIPQHLVDREAKKVSAAMRFARDSLISQYTETHGGEAMRWMLRRYRT